MKNTGKIFEQQFTKYFPKYCLVYKIPDSTASYNGSHLTYSVKNPFDYIIYDSQRKKFLCLELKTIADKSISFERTKDEKNKKKIHYHQITGLNHWQSYGIESGFVIEFRALEKTIYVNINDFNKLIQSIDKSSINYDDFEKLEIPHITIDQSLLKVNYKYDIEKFLEDISQIGGKNEV